MALVKQFDTFINEAADAKKYKQWWDKGPETQIRRKFGKDYEKSINNRVNLLLTLVDDPDKAEEYAEMDFLSLPNGISTQLVNMDPKELHAILDESALNEKLSSSDIKKATQAIKDYVKKLGKRANGELSYVAAEIASSIGWNEKKRSELETYLLSINNGGDTIIFGESLTEAMELYEARANTAKAALRNASDALKQTIPGSKLPKSYVKDYLESLERMAKRVPQLFVKQYGDFTINDYLEDVRYNMANESVAVNEAKYEKGIEKATTMKDVKKLYPNAKTTSEVHGASFYIELEKDLFAKAFSEDTRRDIEPFKIEGVYKMKGKRQEWLYTESVTEAKGESNEELMFNFLEALRASGATNMFGAAPYLQDSFGLSKSEAKKVLIKWMKSYESVTEARVDGKTIDGLTNKLAKIVKELKDNFLEYKKAKTDADKKKWTKRAKELTGLKQSTMDGLHKAIEAFHKDVEYDEAYESLLESTIGIKISGRAEMKYMDQIRKELDKAKIKYKFNRLSMTLSVLDMDKKDFAEAKKIVDDSELTILMAKESRVYE